MNDPTVVNRVRMRRRQHTAVRETDEHLLEYPREALLSCMEELERAMEPWRLRQAGAQPED